MKKTLSLLSVSVLSTALFTGCPSGGGSSSTVGVTGTQVSVFANESCDVQANMYSCSQVANGITYNTPAISFSNQQEFCSRIVDGYSNLDANTRSVQVAQATRNNLYQTRCQGLNTGGTTINPGNNLSLKTFECMLQVRKGSNTFPGQTQQFQLASTGGTVTLFANGMRNRQIWGGVFNAMYSVRLATVKMEYIPALTAATNSMDQIRMSVNNVDNDTSTSITGYAGAETRIEITPQELESEQTELIASCRSLDATVKNTAATSDKYQCVGTEKYNSKTAKINYVNQVSDVVNSGISITNSVFVQGDDAVTMAAGAVSFSQTNNQFEESEVKLKSTLGAATSISIEKLGYSLKVKCSPK